MATLHQITPPLTSVYKAVRLRALQDTPSAFGSTYTRESQFSDADWKQRTANLDTPRSIGYLAREGDYCGIAVSFLNERDPQRAELMSMWVAPEQRRTGTGRLLVDAIESWAHSRGAHTSTHGDQHKPVRHLLLSTSRLHQNRTNRALPQRPHPDRIRDVKISPLI